MKILLVGEYSRLHNSLKEGLIALGHEVTLVSTGDGFKDYPSDIKLKRQFSKGILKKFKVLLFKVFKTNITDISILRQFFKNAARMEGYDVVQLINESPLGIDPKYEKEVISFLKKNNEKLFLLSCGTDHVSVSYDFQKKRRYSILNPLFEGKISKKDYAPALKYMNPDYKELHQFVYDNINGVIASDLDYHIPLEGHSKYLGLVPNPVNIVKQKFEEHKIDGKIVIFHGINRANYYKKGSNYFQKALKQIQLKYEDNVEILIVEDLPYSEYISKFKDAHILLDQVLGYDQGYNALEAMAQGKVVFTGAEKEFEEFYNLSNKVAINALPDSEQIVAELSNLIENPSEIEEIGKNARNFIVREHDYKYIAKKYLDIWEQN